MNRFSEITAEKLGRAAYLAPLRVKKQIRSLLGERCPDAMPVFLVGIQRSGTNMLLDVLERSFHTLIYNENNRHAFNNYRVRSLKDRSLLLGKSRYPVVIFKPLNDTLDICSFMADHPGCKVLWMYRRYPDMVNSAVGRWRDFALEAFRGALEKDRWDHVLIHGITEEERRIVARLYRRDLDCHSAWALAWYLRNLFFFHLGLNRMLDRVLLVKYEALVENPHSQFLRVFDFLGIGYEPPYISKVFKSSVGAGKLPKIDLEIERMCENMMMQLDTAWKKQLSDL